MLTAHEEKMVFMAARLQENPTLTYEEAEALYHRSLGFTEADIARLQKRRERQIDRLKAQIDGGTYQPTGEQIAEQVIVRAVAERNAQIRETERAKRLHQFQQEAGIRQDAGVVAAPSSELFVPAVPAPQAPQEPQRRRWNLSLIEWAVIAFFGGILAVVAANACGLITTGGPR